MNWIEGVTSKKQDFAGKFDRKLDYKKDNENKASKIFVFEVTLMLT